MLPNDSQLFIFFNHATCQAVTVPVAHVQWQATVQASAARLLINYNSTIQREEIEI